MLIDAGRKSSMAGAPWTGIGIGVGIDACGTIEVGTSVGFGVGTCVGLDCGVGAMLCIGVDEGADSTAVVDWPQAASIQLTMAIQRKVIIMLIRIPARTCSGRADDIRDVSDGIFRPL